LYGDAVQYGLDQLKPPYLQTQCDRPSNFKFIAFLYQHEETEVMDILRLALS